jgi:hypothetical protein
MRSLLVAAALLLAACATPASTGGGGGGLSRGWLAGSWVPVSSCATGSGFTLHADGSYEAFEGAGVWALEGDRLTLRLTRWFDVEARPSAAETVTYRLRRLAPRRMRATVADEAAGAAAGEAAAEPFELRRCP